MKERNQLIEFCTSYTVNRKEVTLENSGNEHVSREGNENESVQMQEEQEATRSNNIADEFPLTDIFWLFFSMAHFTGLVLPVKDKTGCYVVSWKCFIPFLLSALSCILSFAYIIRISSTDGWNYSRYVINSESFLTYLFCIRVYLQTMRNVSLMVRHMKNAKILKMRRYWFSPYLIVFIVFSPLMVWTCFTLLSHQLEVIFNLLPSVVLLMFPAILDVLMGIFIIGITTSYSQLRRAISVAKGRSRDRIDNLYQKWVELTEILRTHNKLFGSALHLRIWLFVVNIMVNSYILISLKVLEGNCLDVVLVTALPLTQTVVYFFFISSLGEMLRNEELRLLEILLRGTYEEAAGSPEQIALSNFCSRVCARKAELRKEGADSGVTARTFVNKLSLATTTLAILLQLNPAGMADTPEGSHLGTYGHCFAKPNATSDFDFF
ncbi:uncharacterized protein [Palaemon carinicauda]|uniref:uncharacterized protein n=1 Tax=Palaemon carinicauda TaxID=392227 RepID=UPI0035B587A5